MPETRIDGAHDVREALRRQGTALRQRRERLGMTMPELAARNGLSPMMVQRVETGDYRCRALDAFARVARVHGLRVTVELAPIEEGDD